MRKFKIEISDNYYPHNVGQNMEANIRAMFGQLPKADNRASAEDIVIDGKSYQIKSWRATVTESLNLEDVRTKYGSCDGFIFAEVTEANAYVMTVEQFISFAKRFAEASVNTNTGKAKLRLNREKHAQLAWLKAEEADSKGLSEEAEIEKRIEALEKNDSADWLKEWYSLKLEVIRNLKALKR